MQDCIFSLYFANFHTFIFINILTEHNKEAFSNATICHKAFVYLSRFLCC